MKHILFALCTLLIVQTAFSQSTITQTIRGTVVDKDTRVSLPGANVILLESDPIIGTSTDINGRFVLNEIPIGRIGIKVSFIGYNDMVLSNLNLTSGKELVLNVELEETVITSEEVVITATQENILVSGSGRTLQFPRMMIMLFMQII